MMMTEPTGLMDQAKRSPPPSSSSHTTMAYTPGAGRDSITSLTGGYQVCDLADEEVHFSRNPLEQSNFYYYSYDASLQQPSSLNDISLTSNQNQQVNNHHVGSYVQLNNGTANGHSNMDQMKSSRLLNSLSSRLRRGSNYLNASKMVGQYLLGITIQNWSEFFNTSRMMMKTPTNRQQLARRLLANLSYFQGNYLCVSLVLVIYCILTSPLLLLAIAIYLLALYLITVRSALGKQTRIFGYRLNLQQQYSFLTMLSLPPLWIAGAPSALFWVIGASFFVVGLHAAIYANERALAADMAPPSMGVSSNVLSLGHTASTTGNHSGAYNRTTNNNNETTTTASITTTTTQHGRLGVTNTNNNSPSSQYYNHYATSSHRGSHSTTTTTTKTADKKSPYGIMSSYQGPTTTTPTTSQKRNSMEGFMPVALTSWIPFSTSSRSSYGGTGSASETTDNEFGHQRVPEVKIISQDYAGLGRVYEI